jgi:hypothetical protein
VDGQFFEACTHGTGLAAPSRLKVHILWPKITVLESGLQALFLYQENHYSIHWRTLGDSGKQETAQISHVVKWKNTLLHNKLIHVLTDDSCHTGNTVH